MAFRTSALVLALTAAFSPLAAAQEQDTAVAAPTAATAGQPAAPEIPAKPPTEAERLRAEVETLRRQLGRQMLIADNARGQLDRARAEAKLKDELIELGRTRNAELLKLGREILDRYARKDFFALVGGSEPFVQSSRVRLENLVQDYEDKLRAQRFTKDTLPPSVEARMRAELAAPAEAKPASQPEPNNP
ncbi:hypothetical protein OK349_03025 [Sphingomonas sp. BT-65]|uniref:hypothetical protein n=1 Tax=Sphingomonas sp. BT-65 TaxID=2989821 RepID=UPI00223623FB|nr:hypothetical protein [Sphingomonas sp. BT-65]MCW4460664.1 hypothetical protein [Sphingomonas sp. BT-65]